MAHTNPYNVQDGFLNSYRRPLAKPGPLPRPLHLVSNMVGGQIYLSSSPRVRSSTSSLWTSRLMDLSALSNTKGPLVTSRVLRISPQRNPSQKVTRQLGGGHFGALPRARGPRSRSRGVASNPLVVEMRPLHGSWSQHWAVECHLIRRHAAKGTIMVLDKEGNICGVAPPRAETIGGCSRTMTEAAGCD